MTFDCLSRTKQSDLSVDTEDTLVPVASVIRLNHIEIQYNTGAKVLYVV